MSDLDYFQRRLRRAEELADTARDPAIQQIHREFARHYQSQIESLTSTKNRGSAPAS